MAQAMPKWLDDDGPPYDHQIADRLRIKAMLREVSDLLQAHGFGTGDVKVHEDWNRDGDVPRIVIEVVQIPLDVESFKPTRGPRAEIAHWIDPELDS